MKAHLCCSNPREVVRPGWTARALQAVIGFYQRAISPALSPRCRYFPTCSEYAFTALGRFGVCRGLGLAAWRLLRCHPFCRGGADPVPEGRGRTVTADRVAPLVPAGPKRPFPAFGGKQS